MGRAREAGGVLAAGTADAWSAVLEASFVHPASSRSNTMADSFMICQVSGRVVLMMACC
jgi:hypothetical protein